MVLLWKNSYTWIGGAGGKVFFQTSRTRVCPLLNNSHKINFYVFSLSFLLLWGCWLNIFPFQELFWLQFMWVARRIMLENVKCGSFQEYYNSRKMIFDFVITHDNWHLGRESLGFLNLSPVTMNVNIFVKFILIFGILLTDGRRWNHFFRHEIFWSKK